VTPPGGRDRALSYLLGELPEGERDALEEEYFSEREDAFAELKAAEEDILDAYSRGTLTPERRAAVEARWPQSESGRQRLAFAAALSAAAARARAPRPAGLPALRRPNVWLPWAAGLFALAAGGLLIARTAHLQGELRRAHAEAESARQAAVRELERLRKQAAGLEALLQARDVERVASLVLAGGLRRDFEPVPRLVLPPDTTLVRLTLLVKADSHESYVASVQTAEGRDLWVREDLPAQPAEAGRALVLSLPAGVLAAGHHVVIVRGTGQDPADSVAEYVFQVVRPAAGASPPPGSR
jgi:hypothetical protein